MRDLFHHSVPVPFIQRVFDTMAKAHWHQFQILTKRSGRLLGLSGDLDWHPNVWMGVSVETAEYKSRIDHLRSTGAAIKLLSLEPPLGDLGPLDLDGIDWVIVGGESGPGARPVHAEWITGIRGQCEQAQVPFFFKQWGGVQKKRAGRILDGRTWANYPNSGSPDNSCLIPSSHEEARQRPNPRGARPRGSYRGRLRPGRESDELVLLP
jgi:protein gp37